LTTKGFGFVEVVSQCPTAYGRRAGFRNAGEMLTWLKEQSVTTEEAKRLTEKELESKVVVGEFVSRSRPSLTEMIQAVLKEARKS